MQAMPLSWAHKLDIARTSVAQRATRGSFAGSIASQPREQDPPPSSRGAFSAGAALKPPVGLAWWRGPRWMSSSLSSPVVGPCADGRDVPSMRAALDALARTVAAVQARHLAGEGAPNNGARGIHAHP